MANQFGLIGLGVMGSNLARNIGRNGFSTSVYNYTPELTRAFMRDHGGEAAFTAFEDLPAFVQSLARPRRILIMIQAGEPVDSMLGALLPLLEKGDIVIDGGNSNFLDTERRVGVALGKGVHFVGMGISGGEEGALHGPSLMPGGSEEAYHLLEPILKKIAAKSDSGPCVAYMGKSGAGHYVKMVHNGIEYGDMQLIAEAYQMLKTGLGMPAREIAQIFTEWNKGPLKSYLIEITAKIVAFPDDGGGSGPLVDKILDRAGQKGTGKWTIASALEQAVAVPTMAAAVDARILSAAKSERTAAAKLYAPIKKTPKMKPYAGFTDKIAKALYASKICSYAQGFALLAAAGKDRGYGIRLGEVARIWKNGCIIRAEFLDLIRKAYDRKPDLANLTMDPDFAVELSGSYDAWREALIFSYVQNVPSPATAASFAYFSSYTTETLPANLIQAQRDYFGAHTYERVDKPGVFHTLWIEGAEKRV